MRKGMVMGGAIITLVGSVLVLVGGIIHIIDSWLIGYTILYPGWFLALFGIALAFWGMVLEETPSPMNSPEPQWQPAYPQNQPQQYAEQQPPQVPPQP
ncbi:MAG: hypothetical protein ACE5IO_06375 [Thermoplasmata archaeon]